mmetsp:Transcript_25571/g.60837  ORF Transcript_25571/g.60837 Transcript_25571/m.60837 type:complete len:269 (-) Transcript_25571:39-845(-)
MDGDSPILVCVPCGRGLPALGPGALLRVWDRLADDAHDGAQPPHPLCVLHVYHPPQPAARLLQAQVPEAPGLRLGGPAGAVDAEAELLGRVQRPHIQRPLRRLGTDAAGDPDVLPGAQRMCPAHVGQPGSDGRAGRPGALPLLGRHDPRCPLCQRRVDVAGTRVPGDGNGPGETAGVAARPRQPRTSPRGCCVCLLWTCSRDRFWRLIGACRAKLTQLLQPPFPKAKPDIWPANAATPPPHPTAHMRNLASAPAQFPFPFAQSEELTN